VKRFNVTGVTRDKIYDLTGGKSSSDVHYFSANPNGEAEVVTINLRQAGSIKKLKWEFDFADVLIKGRASKGNIVTKYSVKRIELKEKGISTLKPRKLWFDDTVQRLNTDDRGELLGEFTGQDRLLTINQKGEVKTTIPEISMRFDDDMIVLEKWKPNKPISIIHFDGEKERYYVKRFLVEKEDKVEHVISDHPKSVLELVSTDWRPLVELEFAKPRGKEAKPNQQIDIEQFIALKGIKAHGNQLTAEKVKNINALEPLPFEEPVAHDTRDIEVVDEEDVISEESVPAKKSPVKKASKQQKDDEEAGAPEGQTTLF
jgi:topoisomerase-4 subunit A